jgi:hypothetical protein
MIDTVKVTQNLLDAGFTHGQATAVAKALKDTANDGLTEHDLSSAERQKAAVKRLAEADGALEAECRRLRRRLALFELKEARRHREAAMQAEALCERLARQLSDSEQKILLELSQLQRRVIAELWELKIEIVAKAAAITSTVHACASATLIVVALTTLAALILN